MVDENNANHDEWGGKLHEFHSPYYDTALCMTNRLTPLLTITVQGGHKLKKVANE